LRSIILRSCIDFSWRSEHEMTVKAKPVIQAFYGTRAQLSYWNGCSTGGRQGSRKRRMFPTITMASSPARPRNRTRISLWIADAVLKDPPSYIPPASIPSSTRPRSPRATARDG
jgi:hypothetical protein